MAVDHPAIPLNNNACQSERDRPPYQTQAKTPTRRFRSESYPVLTLPFVVGVKAVIPASRGRIARARGIMD